MRDDLVTGRLSEYRWRANQTPPKVFHAVNSGRSRWPVTIANVSSTHTHPGVGVMSRTKIRLKVEPAPTRGGTTARWTDARDFKRRVRFVSQPGCDQAPDLLCRLEREVGPLADALTRAKPRSVLSRALLRTAIAGTAMAVLVIAWQHTPSDARNTEATGGRMISEAKEVTRPRAALVEPEAKQEQLQVWHDDSNMLLYRSPWRPR
jgi:hypothetical protein